jgi:hypothetical protein
VPEAAERFDVDKSTVTRWQAWTVHEDAQAAVVGSVPRPDGLPISHFDWTVEHIPSLIDGFLEFREKYFTTERGVPFVSPGFQQEWAKAILTAKVTGGKEMILAPVRHGKTQLLTHFCVYLFCLDPNLRVLWLGVTQGLAEGPLEQMRGIFESNEKLIEDYAGPGGTFKPETRSIHKWRDRAFTLATRTNMEIAGPNVQALGRGNTVIGKNADIVILDDIEDQDAVAQKGTRDKTKEWWITQLGSRVEEHTGLFVIGSRQDYDDIYGLIMKEPGWNVTVERAHDPACDIGDDDEHWDCLLFPEVRSYKWLMAERARAAAGPYGVALWERIFQNIERIDGLVVFPDEEVKACRRSSYRATVIPTSTDGGIRLVAGLDPAISGFQAAVLLAYQTVPDLRIWLVDLDNQRGGGITAAAELIRHWYETYGVVHWVAESNLLGRISQYKEVKEYTDNHGIYVEDWRTYQNKTDKFFGVTALAPLFRNKNFTLPYPVDSDGKYSRQITDTLVAQLVVWDEGNSRNKNRTGFKDDLVMALWFAWDPIRRARQDYNTEAGVDMSGMPFAPDGWNDVPWADWNVPPWEKVG